MRVRKLLLNFTNTYRSEDYDGFEMIDLSSVSGTDMYLDDEANSIICEKITGSAVGGIHLLDSGNYHYMTELFLRQINEPFCLIYFDNHTDMKPAMFDMLSCGSWAKKVLDGNLFLSKMVMIGPPRKSIEEIDCLNSDRLLAISQEECLLNMTSIVSKIKDFIGNESIYFSIDKDVLSVDVVSTNWDQGKMTQSELENIVECVGEGCKVLGADICGLLPEREKQSFDVYDKGLHTDLLLVDLLSKLISKE